MLFRWRAFHESEPMCSDRRFICSSTSILSYDVPTPQQLGIPQSVVNLTTKMRGLVLVTELQEVVSRPHWQVL
ncbi:MAG: hypothetical protein ACLRI8_06890 [Agathobacter rectalis]